MKNISFKKYVFSFIAIAGLIYSVPSFCMDNKQSVSISNDMDNFFYFIKENKEKELKELLDGWSDDKKKLIINNQESLSRILPAFFHKFKFIVELLLPYFTIESINHFEYKSLNMLFGAVYVGDMGIFKYILSRCTIETINKSSNKGETPLFTAIGFRSPEMVELLLKSGAKKSIPILYTAENATKPITALCFAFYKNYLDLVKLLLPYCEENIINKVYADIATPLFMATYHNNLQMVKSLLEYGADVDDKAMKNSQENKDRNAKFVKSVNKENRELYENSKKIFELLELAKQFDFAEDKKTFIDKFFTKDKEDLLDLFSGRLKIKFGQIYRTTVGAFGFLKKERVMDKFDTKFNITKDSSNIKQDSSKNRSKLYLLKEERESIINKIKELYKSIETKGSQENIKYFEDKLNEIDAEIEVIKLK